MLLMSISSGLKTNNVIVPNSHLCEAGYPYQWEMGSGSVDSPGGWIEGSSRTPDTMDRPSLFIMPITRERTKPKWFCGEARQKGREGKGASKCVNGLHLITTNPDIAFFVEKRIHGAKCVSCQLFSSAVSSKILHDKCRGLRGHLTYQGVEVQDLRDGNWRRFPCRDEINNRRPWCFKIHDIDACFRREFLRGSADSR